MQLEIQVNYLPVVIFLIKQHSLQRYCSSFPDDPLNSRAVYKISFCIRLVVCFSHSSFVHVCIGNWTLHTVFLASVWIKLEKNFKTCSAFHRICHILGQATQCLLKHKFAHISFPLIKKKKSLFQIKAQPVKPMIQFTLCWTQKNQIKLLSLYKIVLEKCKLIGQSREEK